MSQVIWKNEEDHIIYCDNGKDHDLKFAKALKKIGAHTEFDPPGFPVEACRAKMYKMRAIARHALVYAGVKL